MQYCLQRDLSATLSIHKLASHCFAAGVATGFALPCRGALVGMLGVSEDTGRPRGGVGRHEFTMLREAEKSLVPVVVATERSDDTLVQVVQEAFSIAVLLGLWVASWGWGAHGLLHGGTPSHGGDKSVIVKLAHVFLI